jgi:cysteine-rich repeat protein
MTRAIVGLWQPLAWLALLVVTGCGDSSANDGGSGGETNDGPLDAPGDGDPGDGDPGDGDPGDGDPGDGDGDSGDGDGDSGDGDGDGVPGDGDGDPPLGCGDGELDPGEACDDGNNEPGDGCSAFCQAPGELIWETVVDLDAQLDEIGRAVVVDLGGNIGVIVEQSSSWLLVRFDLHGELGWSVSSVATERPSLVLGPGGQLIAGGQLGSQGVTRAWDSAGDQLWTAIVPDGDSGILGLAIDADNDVVAAGYHPGPNGFLARYDSRGMEVWVQSQEQVGALGPVAAGDHIWAARQDADALERFDLDGAAGWQISPLDGDVVRDLVADADGHVYVLTEAGDQSGFSLSRYDSEGALVWSQTHDAGAEVSVGGVDLLPGGGGLLVAGTNLDVDLSDGLLVWYDLDGEPLADDVVLDLDDVDALHDVAVTPYNYAVAVGVSMAAGSDADLWIRKFEI